VGLPVCALMVYMLGSRFKKGYIHVGVSVGGTSRGFISNAFGSSSPFFIRVAGSSLVTTEHQEKKKTAQSSGTGISINERFSAEPYSTFVSVLRQAREDSRQMDALHKWTTDVVTSANSGSPATGREALLQSKSGAVRKARQFEEASTVATALGTAVSINDLN
jgi:hypothetical protein